VAPERWPAFVSPNETGGEKVRCTRPIIEKVDVIKGFLRYGVAVLPEGQLRASANCRSSGRDPTSRWARARNSQLELAGQVQPPTDRVGIVVDRLLQYPLHAIEVHPGLELTSSVRLAHHPPRGSPVAWDVLQKGDHSPGIDAAVGIDTLAVSRWFRVLEQSPMFDRW